MSAFGKTKGAVAMENLNLREFITTTKTGKIKAADKISALIKCIEERKAGNVEFSKAEQSTLDSIKQMNLCEAEDFINEFLPGFELTLDQLT